MQSENIVDMTKGSTWKIMLNFALPVFLSQVFQQMYNTADSLIVGRFLGTDSLAAVSSASNMVYLIINFFTGLSIGAGILISKYFGANDKENLSKAIHTDVLFGLISGLLVSLAGYFFTPTFLSLMKVDSQITDLSIRYYKIYFLGSITVVMYSLLQGALNALGDSKRPLYYLIISSVINVILDLVFVAGFGFGVWSAAFATVISQLVSTILCLIHLCQKGHIYTLEWSKMKFDLPMMGDMVKYGMPSGIANCVIGLANVIVQSSVNSFGMYATAAFGVHSKIEGFGFLPITSFTMAISTFVSQNLGAKEYERAKKGAVFGIVTSVILAEIIGIILYFTSGTLFALFDDNPQVIEIGVLSEHIMALFYCVLAFSHAVAAVCRGSGKAFVQMVVMLGVWCVFRIIYITVVMRIFNEISYVFWAYPITWTMTSIIYLIYFLKSDWIHGFEK